MHAIPSNVNICKEDSDDGRLASPNDQKPVSSTVALVSCIMYAFCSVSMVMANKAISTALPSAYEDRLPRFGVVLYQSLVAVFLVSGAKFLKVIDYAPFNTTVAFSWIPLNILFVGMICSGFLSLVYVNVPMVTIFKNLANILTVTGEYVIFKEKVSWLVVLSIGIMAIGALLAGQNDLEFSFVGYFWMTINAFFTAGYILYMRFASTNIKLSKFGMVFYNNLLSIFLILPLVIFSGELQTLTDPTVMTPLFIGLNSLAGFLGFYLNFASLWCVGNTSATTYSIIGSINKIPILILGFLVFKAKMTSEGILFIFVATIGGFLFMYAKLPKAK